jgi:membrane protease YdiL (CAAX protease family)
MIETARPADPADGQFSLTTRNGLVASVVIFHLGLGCLGFGETGSIHFAVAIVVALVIGFFLPIFIMIFRKELGLAFGPGMPVSRVKTVILALPIMIGLRLLALPPEYIATEIFGMPEPDISNFLFEAGKLGLLIGMFIKAGIIAPITEELVFRGLLLSETRRLMMRFSYGDLWSLIVTSLLFGLVHMPTQGIGGGFIAFLLGLGLGTIYIKSRNNLWLVICVHSFSNMATGLAIFYGL